MPLFSSPFPFPFPSNAVDAADRDDENEPFCLISKLNGHGGHMDDEDASGGDDDDNDEEVEVSRCFCTLDVNTISSFSSLFSLLLLLLLLLLLKFSL